MVEAAGIEPSFIYPNYLKLNIIFPPEMPLVTVW